MRGRCLCGAVRIAVGEHVAALSACHCGMCRRWTGSAMFGFEAAEATVAVSGPVRRYASSPFAERAWCDTCGTHLWLKDSGGPYEFVPGLFPEAAEFPLDREVYADQAMAGCRLAGEHPRIGRADYEAAHPHVAGEMR